MNPLKLKQQIPKKSYEIESNQLMLGVRARKPYKHQTDSEDSMQKQKCSTADYESEVSHDEIKAYGTFDPLQVQIEKLQDDCDEMEEDLRVELAVLNAKFDEQRNVAESYQQQNQQLLKQVFSLKVELKQQTTTHNIKEREMQAIIKKLKEEKEQIEIELIMNKIEHQNEKKQRNRETSYKQPPKPP